MVGASIALKGTRVVGIDIDAEPERVRSDVVRYANAAANLLEASFDEADVEVIAGHAGPRTGRWQSHDNVVFLHTGGAPALFAYRSALTI